MNEPKMISEVDAVKRERKAFQRGVNRLWCQNEILGGPVAGEAYDRTLVMADSEYPLPKVTRPRVVRDESDIQWRFVDGYLQWTTRFKSGWLRTQEYEGMAIPSDRIKLWADLLANPTEEIEVGADS